MFKLELRLNERILQIFIKPFLDSIGRKFSTLIDKRKLEALILLASFAIFSLPYAKNKLGLTGFWYDLTIALILGSFLFLLLSNYIDKKVGSYIDKNPLRNDYYLRKIDVPLSLTFVEFIRAVIYVMTASIITYIDLEILIAEVILYWVGM
ncbi:MAG: hypothetical protein AABX38_08340 [Candidatus Micrarchaeota archaeon]